MDKTVRFAMSASGAGLWSEVTNGSAGVPVLLIAGANSSAFGWPDEFVDRLAASGLRVIRYDHRGTGRSISPSDENSYSLDGLATDAVRVLDAWEVSRAHVVGFSLGASLAQVLAIERPDRLASLTLMAGAGLDVDFAGNVDRALSGAVPVDDLPLPDAAAIEALTARMGRAPDNLEDELTRRVDTWRILAGGSRAFAADEVRRWEARAINHAGTIRHPDAHSRARPIPTSRGEELAWVRLRTLVIQGMLDPLNPPPHGRHLAGLIPGARLIQLADLGHGLPSALHRPVSQAILDLIAGCGADPALSAELVTLAGEAERAVARFSLRAHNDSAFADSVAKTVGWHPAQDPAEIWASSHPVPQPVWLATWDHPPDEVAALNAAVARHTTRLRRIVETVGWPSRSMVGADGADAAWFLAMHADGDETLQELALDELRRGVSAGDADPRHVAVLADRLESRRSGRQWYGTLTLPPPAPALCVPIADADRLDQRRKCLGLAPLNDDLLDGTAATLPYRHLRK